jgi:hypothetical protein
LGWIDRDPALTINEAAQEIAARLDRVYLHCYVKDPAQAYPYCQARMNAFLAAKPAPQIIPIFSAESSSFKAGSDVFMGDYLSQNSLDSAESIFLSAMGQKNQIVGFQYYEYTFLDLDQSN